MVFWLIKVHEQTGARLKPRLVRLKLCSLNFHWTQTRATNLSMLKFTRIRLFEATCMHSLIMPWFHATTIKVDFRFSLSSVRKKKLDVGIAAKRSSSKVTATELSLLPFNNNYYPKWQFRHLRMWQHKERWKNTQRRALSIICQLSKQHNKQQWLTLKTKNQLLYRC